MKKCKARGRVSKKPCGNPPMTGREVCRMHGGATPRGAESPHYRHGLYSRYARLELAEKISALRAQEELLFDLREVLAVQGALLAEALERQELAAAIPITETLSRSIERYHRHPAPVVAALSPEQVTTRLRQLLQRQKEIMGNVTLEEYIESLS